MEQLRYDLELRYLILKNITHIHDLYSLLLTSKGLYNDVIYCIEEIQGYVNLPVTISMISKFRNLKIIEQPITIIDRKDIDYIVNSNLRVFTLNITDGTIFRCANYSQQYSLGVWNEERYIDYRKVFDKMFVMFVTTIISNGTLSEYSLNFTADISNTYEIFLCLKHSIDYGLIGLEQRLNNMDMPTPVVNEEIIMSASVKRLFKLLAETKVASTLYFGYESYMLVVACRYNFLTHLYLDFSTDDMLVNTDNIFTYCPYLTHLYYRSEYFSPIDKSALIHSRPNNVRSIILPQIIKPFINQDLGNLEEFGIFYDTSIEAETTIRNWLASPTLRWLYIWCHNVNDIQINDPKIYILKSTTKFDFHKF